MSHHRLVPDHPGAIFSPSVARIAASAARDWSYVDSWLATKLSGNEGSLPHFERNQDTLKAMIALVTVNEAVDDQHRLLARVKNSLSTAATRNGHNESGSHYQHMSPIFREDFLDVLEHNLSKEGEIALDALARTSSLLGVACSDTEELNLTIFRLQGALCETRRMTMRVEVVERYVKREVTRAKALFRTLEADSYKAAPDLAKQNLDVQRKIKTVSAQLPDLQDRVLALAAPTGICHLSVSDIVDEEERYLALLTRKTALQDDLSSLAGLSTDAGVAISK